MKEEEVCKATLKSLDFVPRAVVANLGKALSCHVLTDLALLDVNRSLPRRGGQSTLWDHFPSSHVLVAVELWFAQDR